MMSTSDWRNPQQKHGQGTERRVQEQGGANDCTVKKHQNLESNLFGTEEHHFDKKSMPCDKLTDPKDRVINKGSTKVDTYAKRQNNLTSQILDTGNDYGAHKPFKKKKQEKADNVKDEERRTDHLYSDLFGQSGNGGRRSPQKKRAHDLNEGTEFAKREVQKDYADFSSKGQKFNNLTSSLDTHTYRPMTAKPAPESYSGAETVQIPGKATQATKVKELSSSILGNDFLSGYNKQKKTAVVDLMVNGLPEDATVAELKKAIGAKHVISATIE